MVGDTVYKRDGFVTKFKIGFKVTKKSESVSLNGVSFGVALLETSLNLDGASKSILGTHWFNFED